MMKMKLMVKMKLRMKMRMGMGDWVGNENTDDDDDDVDTSPSNGFATLAYACATLPTRHDSWLTCPSCKSWCTVWHMVHFHTCSVLHHISRRIAMRVMHE